ncbi:MAG: right-handed parallel beta-helix repeat-containing protein [Candidatus Marinimicrobia bacterium]|nr:right-handed parallel beta-helix repeat-containing protein [Candidatus Neomarinimicrobiota bacterium]
MQVNSISRKVKWVLFLIGILWSISYTQGYAPIQFYETTVPTFSTTRTFADSETLTHQEGFAKGYSLYVQIHLIIDQPIILDGVYKVDMNNDGVWETNSWQSSDHIITFDYPEVEPGLTGSEIIRLKLRHVDNNQFVFQEYFFDVTTLHTPDITFKTDDGDLMVGFISPDGIMDNPLVIVEGFDVFNATWPSYYYYRMQDMILTYLSPAGYDIFFVNFADGSGELQNNAMTVLGALNYIADNNNNFSTKLLGISMGGVISRYALAFAEDPANNINHGCNMFISYDAPQQGAHINTELQNFFGNINNDAINNPMVSIIQAQLQSPSAKQLLRFNFYDQETAGGGTREEIDGGPLYEAFYSELNALNGDGYPNQTYNVGISNGRGDIANHTMESSWSEGQEGNSLMTLAVVGLPLETIPMSYEDILPGSYLPAFRDESIIPGAINMFAGMDFPWPLDRFDVNPIALDYMMTTGNAPCYIWAQSALDLKNVEYSTNPALHADIINWDYSPFDAIFSQSDESFYHDQMTDQSMSYLLSLLLYPQVDVTFNNISENGTLLDGYLSITGYNPQIPSGSQQPVPGYTPLIIKTNQRYLDSGSLKHHHWNSDNNEFHLEHIEEFFPSDIDEARFLSVNDVSIMDNVAEYSVELQLHDPWYFDVSAQTQPDEFRLLSDQDDGGGNVQVFLNQNDQFNSAYPIYSLKAPQYYANTTGIYEFQNWTGNGVDFGEGINNPTSDSQTDVVFLQNNATINAVYSTTPANSIAGNTILIMENLTIPAGANYEFAGNTKISVWGASLNIDGTPDNPVVLKSNDGLHPFYGIETISGGHLFVSNCVIDGATTGIKMWNFAGFINTNNVTFANLSTGVEWEDEFFEDQIQIENSAFYNCDIPLLPPIGGLVPPPDGGGGGSNPSAYPITYNRFDTEPVGIDLDESNITLTDFGMVDPANGDFSLLENSPFIDQGDPNAATDPDGTRKDIGAYYHPQINGTINSDIIINNEASLSGNITIPSGITLTINSGAELNIADNTQIRVNGSMNINGVEVEEIHINSNGTLGEWRGIRVDNGSLNMNYTNISGSELQAIRFNVGTEGIIANCNISNNNMGIESWTDDLEITNTTISDNNVGIFAVASNATITTNDIHSNTYLGLALFCNANPTVKYNLIHDNGYGDLHSGILLFDSAPSLTTHVPADIVGHHFNNQIYNNHGTGIYVSYTGVPNLGEYYVEGGIKYGGFNQFYGNDNYAIYRQMMEGEAQDILYAQANYWYQDYTVVDAPVDASVYGYISVLPTAPGILGDTQVDPNTDRSGVLTDAIQLEEYGQYTQAIEKYNEFVAEKPNKYLLQVALNGLDRCYAKLNLVDPWITLLDEIAEQFPHVEQQELAKNYLMWEYKKQRLDAEAIDLANQLIASAAGTEYEEYYTMEMAMLLEATDGAILQRLSPEEAEMVEKVAEAEERLLTVFADTEPAKLYSMVFNKQLDGRTNNLVPNNYALHLAYPNPFNPITNIKYDIPKNSNVTITVYDILGRNVNILVSNKMIRAGSHKVQWQGTNQSGESVSSGMYFYKIHTVALDGSKTFTSTEKMILLK